MFGAGMLAVLLYHAWPVLYPEGIARAPLNPDCELRKGACTVVFGDGGEVTLSIEPRTIPLVEPLRLTVTLSGLEPKGVEVDFSGVDMNMGYNRVRLEAQGDGRYAGRGILPVCVRARMTWEAKVLLAVDGGYLIAPFRFDTYRLGRAGS
jgi:hypothetical protein